MTYRIFIDLDDTLVAFSDGFARIYGITPNELRAKYEAEGRTTFTHDFLTMLNSKKNFWDNLQELKEGRLLYDYLKKYSPVILTAVPPQPYTGRAVKAKKKWVSFHLGDNVPVIIANALGHNTHNHSITDKHKNCTGPGDILIDDSKTNIASWVEAGGTGILFDNLGSVLKKLQKLGL